MGAGMYPALWQQPLPAARGTIGVTAKKFNYA
jgi:hypothetical protein